MAAPYVFCRTPSHIVGDGFPVPPPTISTDGAFRTRRLCRHLNSAFYIKKASRWEAFYYLSFFPEVAVTIIADGKENVQRQHTKTGQNQFNYQTDSGSGQQGQGFCADKA